MNPSLSSCFYLLAGFALMIIGADRLIKGAVDIAVKFNLSKVLIGAVLIGFGTSAPELFTSLYSASSGEGVLAAGNVIGSNIFNSTLVMGTCLLFPFILSPSEKSWQNIILLLLPSVLILIFASDLSFSALEGVLLLTPLPVFLYLMITQTNEDDEDLDIPGNINLIYSFLWIAIGGAGLYFGSNFAIKGSLELVSILGLSKGFAGAVILAAGTGLPELVTTIVAGVKREISLAFANIIGSNALNVFAVLGISATLFPFNIPSNMAFFNAPILLAVSVFGLLPLMFFTNKYFIKVWAVVLFGAYLSFTYLSI